MESWVVILIFISFLLKSILKKLFSPKTLPPSDFSIPFIGTFLWLRKPFPEQEAILRHLHAKYGPIVSLPISPISAISIADRHLAHQALTQNSAVFADRPPTPATEKIINSNQHTITSARYGPTWRLLRRNITSEILHPSRVKSYSHARRWVLNDLLNRLGGPESGTRGVRVVDHFQYAMFSLLVFMCFGQKYEETKINEIGIAQRRMLVSYNSFDWLNLWPSLTKILFRKQWQEFLQLRKDQEAVLGPLINSRRKKLKATGNDNDDNNGTVMTCYLDTLFDLELPEEKRKLNTEEIVTLCSEFLDAGTDTTSTALQWIMANLVKHPDIQEKLYEEIRRVVAATGDARTMEGNSTNNSVEEEDLQKMPYLKAVVLEGLRRHTPAPTLLQHAVTEDTVLDGYVVPKKGSVNFLLADIGLDPNAWEDPMAFKPERFLNSNEGDSKVEFDMTGTKEIKMMPFGAGRRMCPAYALAMLHLEYFVANLVWRFEWRAVDGDDVDLSEKLEFTIVMKNPLQVRLSPRTHQY